MARTQKEEIAVINTELKYIKESIELSRKNYEEIKELINHFIETADGKYASKKVENIVYAMVGVILLTVLTTILRQIIIMGN